MEGSETAISAYVTPLSPVSSLKYLLRGAIRWEPALRKPCFIWGIWARVSFPTPVLQLCTARGGAKSEPGGWSNYCHPPSSVRICVHLPPLYPHHTLFQLISRPNLSSIIVTHHPPSEEQNTFFHQTLYILIIPSPPIRISYIRSIIVTPHHQCLFFVH